LPDMKPLRVAVSASVVGAVILVFLLVPLPVSRVRQLALVQVDQATSHKVYVTVPGILKDLKVHEGEHVHKGQVLAELTSREVEAQLLEAYTQFRIREEQLNAIPVQARSVTDKQEKEKIQQSEVTLKAEKANYLAQWQELERMKKDLTLVA